MTTTYFLSRSFIVLFNKEFSNLIHPAPAPLVDKVDPFSMLRSPSSKEIGESVETGRHLPMSRSCSVLMHQSPASLGPHSCGQSQRAIQSAPWNRTGLFFTHHAPLFSSPLFLTWSNVWIVMLSFIL